MTTVNVCPGTAARGEPSGMVAARAELGELVVNAAWNVLTYVNDSELTLDVVSLGLVYDVRDEDGVIVVEMTLRAPGPPAAERLPEMARAAVAGAVGGAAPVEVRVVWDPPWSPAMIDSIAAQAAGLQVS
jgi:metal-sulfur cluster biosynthetic enzyme